MWEYEKSLIKNKGRAENEMAKWEAEDKEVMDCNSVVSCNGIEMEWKTNFWNLQLKPMHKFTFYSRWKWLFKPSFLLDVAVWNQISFVHFFFTFFGFLKNYLGFL